MPYIKVSQTKSGAQSVQLASNAHGKTRILAHLGSAHNEVELAELKAAARQLLHRPTGQLDLLTPPADRQRIRTIGHHPYYFEQLVHAYYDKLAFSEIGPQLLFDLVMMRLYEPCSKLRSVRLLASRFRRQYLDETVYQFVRKLGEERQPAQSPKTQLLSLLFEAHQRYYGGNLAVLLYDVTTLYFETARDGDEYKVPGYSKDGKHKDPQILVGLLTNLQGFPLGYESFPGNTFEGHTLLTALTNWQRRFDHTKLRVIADAGMLSKLNCDMLAEAGYDFVVGARLFSLPEKLTELLKAIPKDEGVIQEFEYKDWRLIVQYREKRAKKDGHAIDKAVTKAQAIVDGKQTLKRRSKFLVIDEPSKTAKQLNETAIAESRALAGLKGYLTNISKAAAASHELIAQYHELWHIEKSFRMSKHDLRARPAFHHKEVTIKGHLLIVIMALAVTKLLEKESELSLQSIVDQLSDALSYIQQDALTSETWMQHPGLSTLDVPASLQALLEPLTQSTKTEGLILENGRAGTAID